VRRPLEVSEVLLPAAGKVDGVAGGRTFWERGSNLRCDLVGEERQPHPALDHHVGGESDMPPTVAYDADAPAAGPVRHQQALRQLDHLARRADAQHPARAAGRIDCHRCAHHRAGVRSGSLRAGP